MTTTAKTKNGSETKKTKEEPKATPFKAFTSFEGAKEGFEKVAKSYEDVTVIQKDAYDAAVKSANVTAKNLETIATETFAFSKKSVEDSVSVAKAAMAASSPQEAFEAQGAFAKTAFDAYVGHVTKMNDLFVSAAKDSAEPFSGQVNAFMGLFQGPRS